MKHYLVLIIFSVLASCSSKRTSVQDVLVTDPEQITSDSVVGTWTINSFFGAKNAYGLNMDFDSTYLDFYADSTFGLFNLPMLESKIKVDGEGQWILKSSDNHFQIILNGIEDFQEIPLDRVYNLVYYDGILTLSPNFDTQKLALSFQKEE